MSFLQCKRGTRSVTTFLIFLAAFMAVDRILRLDAEAHRIHSGRHIIGHVTRNCGLGFGPVTLQAPSVSIPIPA